MTRRHPFDVRLQSRARKVSERFRAILRGSLRSAGRPTEATRMPSALTRYDPLVLC
jgi:hypothetical protein